MFCSNCGFNLPDGAKFCGRCGQKVRKPEAAPEPIPVPEPTPAAAPEPTPASGPRLMRSGWVPVSEAPKAPEPVREEPQPEPVPEAPQPEPVPEAPQPEPVFEEPQPEPVYEAPQPEPVYEAPQPEPVYEAPQPEPVYEAPQPEPVYEAPVYRRPTYEAPTYTPRTPVYAPEEPVYEEPADQPAFLPEKEPELPKENRPLSPWAYFGFGFLFSIPVVGWILLIVLTFAAKNVNLRNFARSFWFGFILVLAVLLVLLVLVLTGVLKGPIQEGINWLRDTGLKWLSETLAA